MSHKGRLSASGLGAKCPSLGRDVPTTWKQKWKSQREDDLEEAAATHNRIWLKYRKDFVFWFARIRESILRESFCSAHSICALWISCNCNIALTWVLAGASSPSSCLPCDIGTYSTMTGEWHYMSWTCLMIGFCACSYEYGTKDKGE